MSLAFLLLGETNVAFYNRDSGVELPPAGALGGILDVVEFFAQPAGYSVIGSEQALFTLDVSIRENHQRRSQVTRHPVEDGSEVSDHIHLQPKSVTIEGIQTDTPSGLGALLIVPGMLDRFASTPRSVEAWQYLDKLQSEKTILDVLTGLCVYRNMVITNLNAPRSAQTGRALQFSITLEEIIIVGSATVGGTDTIPDGMSDATELGNVEAR